LLIFEKYGADALRYYLLTSPVMLADNLNFSEKGVSDALRKINMTLWNVLRFYDMFNQDLKPEAKKVNLESKNVLDMWILARLNQLIEEVDKGMKNYNLPEASRPIAKFIDDLSTWYLRRSRDRFKGADEKDKALALKTTKFVLEETAKIIAPFAPFIAEQVWQKVSGFEFKDENRSVHLESWSSFAKASEDKAHQTDEILREMEMARKIVELGLAERDIKGIKVRQPLRELRIKNYELRSEFVDLIKDELNVKNVVFEKGEGNISVELDTEITPELELEGMKREFVRLVNSLRKTSGFSINDRINIFWQGRPIIGNMLEKFKDGILMETLANEVIAGSEKELADGKEFNLNKEMIVIAIEKN
jgi:isoleucyl-tRNA synthetase